MKRVLFYYDIVCPYAYLGHTQIERVCADADAEFVTKPFLLGGVFRAIGAADVPMAQMSAAKATLNMLDMQRWATRFRVSLTMPSGHPFRTVLALRAAIASADVWRASQALFEAYWVQSQDVSMPEVVKAALDGAGLDGAAAVAQAETDACKADLRSRTDEAIADGVFGAPAFVVEHEGNRQLFWGQDRLHFVERALKGWAPAIGRGPRVASASASTASKP